MFDLSSLNTAITFLDEVPNLEPLHVNQGHDAEQDIHYGSYAIRGIRDTMEDEIVIECDVWSTDDDSVSCFAVFDGHGGSACSKFLAENWIPQCEKQGKSLLQFNANVEKLFLQMDENFEAQQVQMHDKIVTEVDAGSTANVLFVKKNKKINDYELICCNCGDSRSILCTGRSNEDIIALSYDHKPKQRNEKRRIENAGGFVSFDRINGELAVSRCFGDFLYKQHRGGKDRRNQMVVAVPEIERITIDYVHDQFQFVVMACDGVWDVLNNRQVGQFVLSRLKKQKESKQKRFNLQDIARDLCEYCAVDQSSTDNISVLIILFQS